jgi:hypothetical protein
MRLAELPYLYFTDTNRAFIPGRYKIFVCFDSTRFHAVCAGLVIDALPIVCNNHPCRSLIVADRSLICRRYSARWKINNFSAVDYKLRGSNAFSDHACF